MGSDEVEFSSSSVLAGAAASAVRITEERYEHEGDYIGGGWCADGSDGTDETWTATFTVSVTLVEAYKLYVLTVRAYRKSISR